MGAHCSYCQGAVPWVGPEQDPQNRRLEQPDTNQRGGRQQTGKSPQTVKRDILVVQLAVDNKIVEDRMVENADLVHLQVDSSTF
jgi:hypothetical protein